VLRFLTRLARELNWSRRSWSSATDEKFHDELYFADTYEPFSWAYPGYVTIRRFADIVEPYLPRTGQVVDLGCGPGEITCELAARRNDLQFLGIDHSAAAIAKADTNAGRCGVRNIRFERGSVQEYRPAGSVDLVALFDSFHHLTRPAEFVKRLSPHVNRWALIEPRGNWAGAWLKDIDFDWLAQDLEKVRAHIASVVGSMASTASTASPATASGSRRPAADSAGSGLAVERRYALDDWQRFFGGYALDLRGTVAGLERYPPGWNQPGPLRDRFGQLQWELYRDIDEWLYERNLDLYAKHWLIVAEKGGRRRDVTLAPPPQDRQKGGTATGGAGVAGQFDIRYGRYSGPSEAAPGERVFATIEVTNIGWDTWSSEDGVFVSYHWLDAGGRIVEFDGQRTPLPRPIGHGETCPVAVAVRAPDAAGRYNLAIDLVREGVTWFSEAGHPWLAVPFTVR
jgi:SAM-dependent methyltransferase